MAKLKINKKVQVKVLEDYLAVSEFDPVDSYWYMLLQVALSGDDYLNAAINMQFLLARNDVKYRKALNDLAKCKFPHPDTKTITIYKKKLDLSSAPKITKVLQVDLVEMQQLLKFPIINEVDYKYDEGGNRSGLSRKPSARKILQLNKQLSLKELWYFYATHAYILKDIESDDLPTSYLKSKKDIDNEQRTLNTLYPNKFLKTNKNKVGAMIFFSGLLRLKELPNFDDASIISLIRYLVEQYMHDKSWLVDILGHDQATLVLLYFQKDVDNFELGFLEATHFIFSRLNVSSKPKKKLRKNMTSFALQEKYLKSQSQFHDFDQFIKESYFSQ